VAGLAVALRYLTIVPFPARAGAEPAALGRAAVWFPLIGLGLGLVVAAGERVLGKVFPPLLDSLLAVTLWKLLTGGLHLDGLADCLDGVVGRDAADRLRIMRDSRIGAFGAIGLILFLLLEVAAVTELTGATRWRTLAAAPAVARAMPPLVAWIFPAARPLGQGAMFRAGLTRTPVVIALLLGGGIASAALGAAGLLVFALITLSGLALGRFFTRRIGGVTGDVLGAVIETAELIALLTIVAWTNGRR
jgi:adenosylcobinamide-GDP ribazoletransferase